MKSVQSEMKPGLPAALGGRRGRLRPGHRQLPGAGDRRQPDRAQHPGRAAARPRRGHHRAVRPRAGRAPPARGARVRHRAVRAGLPRRQLLRPGPAQRPAPRPAAAVLHRLRDGDRRRPATRPSPRPPSRRSTATCSSRTPRTRWRQRIQQARQRKKILKDIFIAIDDGQFDLAAQLCVRRFEVKGAYWLYAARIGAELLLRVGQHDQARALYEAVIATQALPWARLGVARAQIEVGRRPGRQAHAGKPDRRPARLRRRLRRDGPRAGRPGPVRRGAGHLPHRHAADAGLDHAPAAPGHAGLLPRRERRGQEGARARDADGHQLEDVRLPDHRAARGDALHRPRLQGPAALPGQHEARAREGAQERAPAALRQRHHASST